MTEVEAVASHTLAVDELGMVIDTKSDTPFDVASYSKMKYGNREVTRRFAHALTEDVLQVRPGLVEDEQPPLFPASFSVVPPVPFHLSRYVLETINEQRRANDLEAGGILQVDRSRTQTSNYAVLTAEERREEWDSIDFFFSNGEDDRLAPDTPIVILDDVRITGSFTRKLLGVFEDHDPARMMLGFVAVFEPQQARQHPEVEDLINGTTKMGVETILPEILNDNFDLNIRTLKMILCTDADRLIPFLEQCPPHLLEKMLADTIASGPDFVEYHRPGYEDLRALTLERAA
jgi:hypothetical protein